MYHSPLSLSFSHYTIWPNMAALPTVASYNMDGIHISDLVPSTIDTVTGKCYPYTMGLNWTPGEQEMGRLPNHAQGLERKYEIQHLWDKQLEILRQVSIGLRHMDVAAACDVTPQNVSDIVNSELGQARLTELREERDKAVIGVSTRIKELVPKAISIMEGILDNADLPDTLRLRAAQDVLGRGGYVPPTKVIGSITHGHYTGSELEEIKRKAIEKGLVVTMDVEEPLDVDVEMEEVLNGSS